MNIKLEAMVGYLSGKRGDPHLRDELANPSSEASRFLEATRLRSRALLDEPILPDEPIESAPSRPWRRVFVVMVAVVSLVGAGVAIVVGEARVRRLEASLKRIEDETRDRDLRLEAALGRLIQAQRAEPTPSPPDPIGPALSRVESALLQIEKRLDGLNRPSPGKAQALAEVRDDLATLRHEVSASEKANARRDEDSKATLQETARLLRLLIGRSQPPEPAPRPPAETNPRRRP